MLGTLMKYEFKAVSRILMPLYGAWLIVAILFGIATNTSGSFTNVFLTISGTLYGFLAAAAVIVSIIIIIQRFYKNLLGNEGYLMFTLPVSTGKHLMNKIFSGVIWVTIGSIVAGVSALLIAVIGLDIASLWTGIKEVCAAIMDIMGSGKAVLIIVECLIIFFAVAAEAVTKVYAAIAVGHQWGNHRILGAIGAYIGFAIIEVIIVTIIGNIIDKGNTLDAFMIMLSEKFGEFGCAQIVLLIVALCIGLLLAVYWFVSWRLLDRRLNLE